MSEYVLSIDQGTTSTRAVVFDHSGAVPVPVRRNTSSASRRPGGWSMTPLRSGAIPVR